MNWSFAYAVLYIGLFGCIYLFIKGFVTGNRVHILDGFKMLLLIGVCFYLLSFIKSRTIPPIINNTSNFFGVSPAMFTLDVFIGIMLYIIIRPNLKRLTGWFGKNRCE